MDTEKVFEEKKEKVDERIREKLSGDTDNFNDGMLYAANDEHRIRSTICLVVADHYGVEDKALDYAVSTELVHNGSLVADDVIDYGKERKGKESVWVAYGLPFAIDISLGMVTKGFESTIEIEDEKTMELYQGLVKNYYKVLEAEAKDLNFKQRERVTYEEHKEMVEEIAGLILSSAASGPAILANASEEEVESLKKFGRKLGALTQIYKGIKSIKEEGGREIKEGKRSLAIVHTLNEASEEDRKKVLKVLNLPWEETQEKELQEVIEIIHKNNSVEYAEETRRKYHKKAIESLNGLDKELKEKLEEIADHILEKSLL